MNPMKRLILLLLVALAARPQLFSQTVAEDVVVQPSTFSIVLNDSPQAQIDHSLEYWKSAALSQGSALAWTEYYRSSILNAANATGRKLNASRKSATAEIRTQADSYRAPAEIKDWLDFQANYMQDAGFEKLRSAVKASGSSEMYETDLAAMHIARQDKAALKESLKRMQQSSVFPPSLMTYAANTLESLPKDAVFIAHGISDAYPMLMRQVLHNQRGDVSIVFLDALLNASYRKSVPGVPQAALTGESDPYVLVEKLALASVRPVCIGLTFSESFIRRHENSLFLYGLCFSWKDKASHPGMTALWEKSFDKRHLSSNASESRNYLPMLYYLIDTYRANGNAGGESEVEAYIRQIVRPLPDKEILIESLEE